MGVVTVLIFGPSFVIRKVAFTSVLIRLSRSISVSRVFGVVRMSYVSVTTVVKPWLTPVVLSVDQSFFHSIGLGVVAVILLFRESSWRMSNFGSWTHSHQAKQLARLTCHGTQDFQCLGGVESWCDAEMLSISQAVICWRRGTCFL